MEFKIEKQENKPLVERDEIIVKITKIDATPSNAQVQEAIAKLTKKNKDLIVIKKIHQKFGMNECVALAYIYTNQEALKKFEPKKKKSKKEEKKEAVKTEEKAKEEKAEKKEEKPAEKPKPEAKPEEKNKEKKE